jgi:hypothetical protein
MMLGGFAVMLGCVLVMFGGLVMVLDACVVAHVSLPVLPCENTTPVYAGGLTLC